MELVDSSLSDCVTLENIKQYIVGYYTKVPLWNGQKRRYINFDNAASTPVLKPVLDKINEFMAWYSSIHRGTGFKSQLCSELYERCREVVLRFVKADPKNHTAIFGKNTTEAVNKLARRLSIGPDQVVLVSQMEHHSNDLPWRAQSQVIHLEIDDQGRLDEDDLISKLKEYGERVALVTITGASNVTGWVNDVNHLAEICHVHGVPIMIDAAQLVPHRRIDMRPQDDPGHIDFLAFSAHKVYAPFGTGVLIGDKRVFEEGDPDLVGGGTVDIVTLNYTRWTEVPEKEEAGSPNVVGVIALAKALQVMESIGMNEIAAHESHLTRYALQRMREVPGIQIYGSADPDRVEQRLGVISFNIQDLSHALVAAILNYEGAIGVRNGCFCAHPYIKRLMNISEEESRMMEEAILRHDRSNIPGAVRVSFGIYNDVAEIDVLVELLHKIAHRQWEARYVLDKYHGEYHLKGFTPNFGEYFRL